MCMYTLVRVRANAARLSCFQVHVSLRGINCCKLSDGAVVFCPTSHAEEEAKWWWMGSCLSICLYLALYPLGVLHDSSTVIFSAHLLNLLALLHLRMSQSQSQWRNEHWSTTQECPSRRDYPPVRKSRQTVDPLSPTNYSLGCKDQNQNLIFPSDSQDWW